MRIYDRKSPTSSHDKRFSEEFVMAIDKRAKLQNKKKANVSDVKMAFFQNKDVEGIASYFSFACILRYFQYNN